MLWPEKKTTVATRGKLHFLFKITIQMEGSVGCLLLVLPAAMSELTGEQVFVFKVLLLSDVLFIFFLWTIEPSWGLAYLAVSLLVNSYTVKGTEAVFAFAEILISFAELGVPFGMLQLTLFTASE